MSESHEGLLLLKNATVNRNLGFDDICKGKHVYVAYNNEPDTFEVSNITGEMVEYPVDIAVKLDFTVAYEWEIQATFFEKNDIEPTWINANYTWGWIDNVTDTWTGACGLIERDEADYAMFGFAGTYARSKMAVFPPALNFLPSHWLTRYPQRLSPTWNLLGLFTKEYISQMSFLN